MRRFAAIAAMATALSLFATTDDAQACGGCFVPPNESTVVTGHRMALSISQEQTVLWDQIQYTGNPEDFSWVLPIKQGATIEVASDAFFDVLDAATNTSVGTPNVWCGGDDWEGDVWDEGGNWNGREGGHYSEDDSVFGCSNSDYASFDEATGSPEDFGGTGAGGGNAQGGGEPPPDVNVVSSGSTGPYDMVTLSTDVPGALNTWLTDNGYNVPVEIQPIIDAYVAEGFDFIALRLSPGADVTQMKPVRVITKGANFALPLRMVAAGTGAKTRMTLFMLGEGRYEVQNFENAVIPQDTVAWNFADDASNFSDRRIETMAQADFTTWITTYAKQGTLLNPDPDQLTLGAGANVNYQVGSLTTQTIAEAYVELGVQNREGQTFDCLQALQQAANSDGVIVDTCDENGENCVPADYPDIAAHELACGELDDLATALVGMHPRDTWVTRLEARLPRAALDTDLVLQAADQAVVENRFFAQQVEEHPCGENAQIGSAPMPAPRGPRIPGGPATLVLAAAAIGLGLRRRRRALMMAAG